MGEVRNHWCFTVIPYTDEDLEACHAIEIGDVVRYIVYQIETCPTTGTPHIQGYMEFRSSQRRSRVKKLICNHVHVEIRHKTRLQASNYCKKEDSRVEGPWERGIAPPEAGGQGYRSDIISFIELVKTGASDKQLLDEWPMQFLSYAHKIGKIRGCIPRPRGIKEPTVIILYGPKGTGKSDYADSFDDVYWFQQGANVQWGDYYQGEEFFVFDEFYGQMPHSIIMHLTDHHPFRLDQRGGGGIWMKSSVVMFTANIPHWDWWANAKIPAAARDAFNRRITHILECHSHEEWFIIKGDKETLPKWDQMPKLVEKYPHIFHHKQNEHAWHFDDSPELFG